MNILRKKGILIAIIIIACAGPFFSFAQSASQLEKNIESKTAELKKLEQEAEKIRKELAKTGSEKASLSRELAIINKEKKSLENNIAQTHSKIGILDDEIEGAEEDIEAQNSKIKKQNDLLEKLIRKIDQTEQTTLLEYILRQTSLSYFFELRDNYISLQPEISEKIDTLRGIKRILRENILSLNSKQEILKLEKEKLNDQNSIIKDQAGKKKAILDQTKNKESNYQQNLKKTLASIAALDKEIRDFESKLKFILNKKALPPKGSAVFDWPLDYVLITQRFGKTTASGRLYKSGSHSGMDFRASVGTPVYAVYDGVVKGTGDTDAVCPRASFGKWVFIEHPVGLSTTSGHLSKIKVKKGDKVKQGDIIGYSGNTGRSTAPHLHLTVYATKGVNGEQGVRITDRPSAACAGKTYTMPLAPTAAYLDPLDYMPKASSSMFKHPSLAGA